MHVFDAVQLEGHSQVRVDRSRDSLLTEFGKATLAPYKDQAGRTATVEGTAAQGAFQSASMELASSKGTRWSDPDLRKWDGDSGTIHSVNWSA